MISVSCVKHLVDGTTIAGTAFVYTRAHKTSHKTRSCFLVSSRLLRPSLDLIIIALVLLLLFTAIKFNTGETSCLDDQMQAGSDKTASAWVALVHCIVGPQVSRDAVYLIPDATIRFRESPVVSSHSYRGPPVLS